MRTENRKARVGERIVIVNKEHREHRYMNGMVLTADYIGATGVRCGQVCVLDSEYEVITEESTIKESIKSKLITIADHYGYEPQADQLVEEMAELTVELNKYRRNGFDSTSASYQNIISEIADVKIMLKQIEYLLDCKAEVKAVMREKVDRQIERIEGEE